MLDAMSVERPEKVGVPRRVLIVEDDLAFVDAIKLTAGPNIHLSVATSIEAGRAAELPDVAIIDLGLPDGDGAVLVAELRARSATMPIVVLTIHGTDERLWGAIRAGASGYLLKEDAGHRLERVVEEALDGGAPMSPRIARRVLALISAGAPEPTAAGAPILTEREIHVLQVLSTGYTYDESATALDISVNTLRTHVRNIYEKLSVSSRTEAVMAALRLGLIQR